MSAVSDIYRIVVPCVWGRRGKDGATCRPAVPSTTKALSLCEELRTFHAVTCTDIPGDLVLPQRRSVSLKRRHNYFFSALQYFALERYSEAIIFQASIPEVPFSNPDWCDVTRPEGLRVFYSSHSVNRIVSSLLYLTDMYCYLLSPPFHINIFHSAYRPQQRWIVGWQTHRRLSVCRCVGVSVCPCTLPTLVVSRFMLGWPQAESLQSEFRCSANLVVVRQESC